MQSLQRDPQEAKDLLANIRAEGDAPEEQPEGGDRVHFEEFIKLM